MEGKRNTEKQISGILKQHEADAAARGCRLSAVGPFAESAPDVPARPVQPQGRRVPARGSPGCGLEIMTQGTRRAGAITSPAKSLGMDNDPEQTIKAMFS